MTTLKEDLTKLFYLHGKGRKMGMKDTELASLVVDYLASLTIVRDGVKQSSFKYLTEDSPGEVVVMESFCVGCGRRFMSGPLKDGLCVVCRGSGETVKPT